MPKNFNAKKQLNFITEMVYGIDQTIILNTKTKLNSNSFRLKKTSIKKYSLTLNGTTQ